jgi:hypothetical protein
VLGDKRVLGAPRSKPWTLMSALWWCAPTRECKKLLDA